MSQTNAVFVVQKDPIAFGLENCENYWHLRRKKWIPNVKTDSFDNSWTSTSTENNHRSISCTPDTCQLKLEFLKCSWKSRGKKVCHLNAPLDILNRSYCCELLLKGQMTCTGISLTTFSVSCPESGISQQHYYKHLIGLACISGSFPHQFKLPVCVTSHSVIDVYLHIRGLILF